jgi:hypothetical protein
METHAYHHSNREAEIEGSQAQGLISKKQTNKQTKNPAARGVV